MDNLWQKVEKLCGKRRNCTFCAISSFVTLLSKRRLLQRRRKASIGGKGLNVSMMFYVNFTGENNDKVQVSMMFYVNFTGESNDKVQRFKRWFWSVVEKMTNHERQDLVSWTRLSPFSHMQQICSRRH